MLWGTSTLHNTWNVNYKKYRQPMKHHSSNFIGSASSLWQRLRIAGKYWTSEEEEFYVCPLTTDALEWHQTNACRAVGDNFARRTALPLATDEDVESARAYSALYGTVDIYYSQPFRFSIGDRMSSRDGTRYTIGSQHSARRPHECGVRRRAHASTPIIPGAVHDAP